MSDKSRQKQSRVGSRKAKRPDYLPAHICESFETELCALVEGLDSSYGFKGDYLRSEYKSKYLDPQVFSPAERQARAIAKWRDAERNNSKTNFRLFLELPATTAWKWVEYPRFLKFVKELIAETLGPLVYPDVLKNGYHTNGASTRVRRSSAAGVEKYAGIADVSSSALTHWLQVANTTRLSDQGIGICEHSILFTVPKKTDIDRVACKEPEINMFLQRQVGSHIRRKLRRRGINLNDQTINQDLARDALKDGLATIDLSAASDSITNQLVFELLPYEWWALMDDLRVKQTLIGTDLHDLEMFSSMGNGFTFELESLIFWALTRAICYFSGVKGKISVYGDDIIVPSVVARRLARTFSWFGFKVNAAKSAWTGGFRESCGKHYFDGLDVTPFYLREKVKSKIDVIRLLNRLMEWDARGIGFLTNPDILAFHRKWAKSIPTYLHGGLDPQDDSALVTGDRPRKRLVTMHKGCRVDESMRLLAWLVRKEGVFEPLSLSVKETRGYRVGNHNAFVRQCDTVWHPWILEDVDQSLLITD